MREKKLTEEELVAGVTPYNVYVDELTSTSESEWTDDHEDAQDRELVIQRKNSPEIDVDLDEL
ncbi:hypothetical protein AB4268_04630 [Vibrio cyclitrophicus]|uniref:hypothetical protein n=1 Tax=Vibrio cyclitrophicus TaxID=47951 RepID=UPI000C83A15D|nr:hypothetical protein [Vibrio cyclitrophicus]PMK20153.1 hypothetical protein BCU04_21555 [Vibrio cyclitrophicus]